MDEELNYRKDKIKEAQRKIEEAIVLIRDATDGMACETRTDRYVLARLRSFVKEEEDVLYPNLGMISKDIETELE